MPKEIQRYLESERDTRKLSWVRWLVYTYSELRKFYLLLATIISLITMAVLRMGCNLSPFMINTPYYNFFFTWEDISLTLMVNMMWVCPFSTSTALLWLMLSNLTPLAARTWSPTLIPCCSASPPGSTLGMIQHRTSTRGAFERKIRLFLSKQGRSRRKWHILRMGESNEKK